MHVLTYIRKYVRTHTHTHIYIYTYTYIHTYIHTFIQTYIHSFVFRVFVLYNSDAVFVAMVNSCVIVFNGVYCTFVDLKN